MATDYPTSLQSIPNPTGSDLLENADAELDHDYQHSTVNDTIEALQAKVGINSSAVTTSHDYKLSEVTSTDKAVSKTATQTLTNKTLTAPQINFGSDANGDLIFRNGSGVTSRLAIGSTDQILAVVAGLPAWVANPSASPASTTVAGIVELATTEETETGTDATRAVTPDGLHDMTTLAGKAWFLDEDNFASDSATKTASQQSIKAYADGLVVFKNGTTTRDLAAADGTQTIAHGLGRIPKFIRLTLTGVGTGSSYSQSHVFVTYNGTTQAAVYTGFNNGSNINGTDFRFYSSAVTNAYITGTVTFDATNISIAWVKTNAPTGTANIMWEAV